MDQQRIDSLGDELYAALREQRMLPPLTDREPGITITDAYHISQRMVSLRVERDGERIVTTPWDVTSSEPGPGNRRSNRPEPSQSYDCPAT